MIHLKKYKHCFVTKCGKINVNTATHKSEVTCKNCYQADPPILFVQARNRRREWIKNQYRRVELGKIVGATTVFEGVARRGSLEFDSVLVTHVYNGGGTLVSDHVWLMNTPKDLIQKVRNSNGMGIRFKARVVEYQNIGNDKEKVGLAYVSDLQVIGGLRAQIEDRYRKHLEEAYQLTGMEERILKECKLTAI